MNSFLEFMKRSADKIPVQYQNIPDIEGCYCTAFGGERIKND